MAGSKTDEKGTRIPYEPPKLFNLGVGIAHAATVKPCKTGGSPAGAQCKAGSSATSNQCKSGGSAGNKCQVGIAAAGGECKAGQVAGLTCRSGNAARGRCKHGGVPA